MVLDVGSALQFLCHPLGQNLGLHLNARKPDLHYHEFSDGFLCPWESKPLVNDELIGRLHRRSGKWNILSVKD